MHYSTQLPGLRTVRLGPHIIAPSVLGETWIVNLSILAVLFSCLCVPFSAAQVSASLSGLITDPSGAAVSAASVTAKNLDTGTSRTIPTDQRGRYRFFALLVGPYEVRVTKEGFGEEVRSGIRLVVRQDATVDLGLRVGQVSEQVKVTEDAPLVSLTTQDISGLVGERQVKDLPLNGRSYDLLLTLNPGIVNFTWEKTGGIGVSNSTTGNNFAVSGNRPQQNIFLCFVRKMGFNFYVDLHIIVNGGLSVREGHRVAHLVEDSVLRELPQISEVLVHVEPEEELAAKGTAPVK